MQRAHEKMYRSRAAFKLKQLDAKFKLFQRRSVVIDLGCHPGGWSQIVMAQATQPEALLVGVDKLLMEPLERQHFVQADIFLESTRRSVEQILKERKAHVVLADLVPTMTGSRIDDHLRSMELNKEALRWALRFLRPNGCFVTKVFQGGGLEAFRQELQRHFARVRNAKPPASRPESVELYLVCQGFLGT